MNKFNEAVYAEGVYAEDIAEEIDIAEEVDPEDVILSKNKVAAERRRLDIKKARKKRRIANEVHPREGREYFENEHQFSKNQVNKRPQHNRESSIGDKRKMEKMNWEKNYEL